MLTNQMIVDETDLNRLDAWMAEHIMGWPIVDNPRLKEVPFYYYGYIYRVPNTGVPWTPTISYDALFEALGKVTDKWAVTFAKLPTVDQWEVLIQVPHTNNYAMACNTDLRIALCKAILFTVVEE